MSQRTLREGYEKAIQFSKLAFIDRPLLGGPGAPAQEETNVSATWSHMNAGFLMGYEYTRWWKESNAMRNTAIIGDWSWINKCIVKGQDAFRFMDYATVKDLSRQEVGQIVFTPMVNVDGKVAIEGLTLRLSENEYMFTQVGAVKWLKYLYGLTSMNVEIEDVTADYTCFALQGPRSIEILEEVTKEIFRTLRFSRWRRSKVNGVDVIILRQGVTGEVGYEFFMRTDTGKAHELWRTIRQVGRKFGLREIGLRTQFVGNTEAGIANAVMDFLPARIGTGSLTKPSTLTRLYITEEELAAIDWNLSEQFCSPAELGWEHTIDLNSYDFHGRAALVKEANEGGPPRRLVGLIWDSDDMAELFAAQFRDPPAPPPPDLPRGQVRMLYLKILKDGQRVGWATSPTYSPNIRRMISLGRIRKDLVEPGTDLTILWGGFSTEPQCKIRAKVVKLPFIKHKRTTDLSAS
jgi:vanillate/3-O-methylgallate O-demethylase